MFLAFAVTPTLLVSVPATGVYYGFRDVTKRMLSMTPMGDTWIALSGAFVGDVVSLCFRTPADALTFFIGDDMLNDILKWTLKEAESILSAQEKLDEFRMFILSELKAFVGLLFVTGVTKGAKESLNQLWSSE